MIKIYQSIAIDGLATTGVDDFKIYIYIYIKKH